MRKKVWFMLLALVLVTTALSVPQQTGGPNPAGALALDAKIPVEPSILTGTLQNGLRYYIRANKQPLNRAELRLVVKAGSVLEEDDQQGLAHFVEHMAFNGTKNFPGEEVVRFLQSLGMRFGADVNASTGFDETTYLLTVPTDRPDTLDKSFLVLEDWAHNVTFDPVEVEKERGVIIEEWRGRRGADARMTDKLFPLLLEGSRYADRLPIGKTEVLQNFKRERLTQFYTDWYRPDLMAVVAVGDFDTAAVEALIRAHFGPIPKPAAARERPQYDIPDHKGALFAILADKEAGSTSVEIDNILPARDQDTIRTYRQHIVDGLFSDMISARFAEIAQKPDAPFVGAFAGRGRFIARTKEQASLQAVVKEGGVDDGLNALLAEAQRVERFGFTATELERAKQNTLRAYERMLTQKETRTSASHAAEQIRNFLVGESLPGADLEYALHQRFLPEITLEEVNGTAKEWFGGEDNRLVIVTAPDKEGVPLPTESSLAALIKNAPNRELTAYVDTVGSQQLLDSPPQPGTVVKTTSREPGITEWELSNGVKVVLKPTDFKADEILFQAVSPGGESLASDADYEAADSAVSVVTAGGLGKFSAVDLTKVLAGKVATVRPSIGDFTEGLSGNASRKDLETLFQLIYLTFTSPRLDRDAFQAQVGQLKAVLANQEASPDFAFSKLYTETIYGNHPRRQPTTSATIDKWDLDKSFAFYKDRFADASDFTFVFVGDLDPELMKPFVERYLASLPATHRTETWKDNGIRIPRGVIQKSVEKGIEPKSDVVMVFSGDFDWNQTQRVSIRAMSTVLQDRLREAIREELGGTYSIGASSSYSKRPRPEYRVTIQFSCDPTRVDELVKRVLAEIEKLKTEGPTAEQAADTRSLLLREFETSIRQNSYVLGQLTGKYDYGEDPAGVWQVPDYYNRLDAPAIQQAAKDYLDTNNRIQVTLLPEKR